MKLARYLLLAAIALPTAAAAQEITFESQDYKAVSTYDSWEASPFRTGQLTGNVAVVRNHLTGEDADLGMTPNATGKVLGFQRSHLASNLYGARIDLNEPFELTKETKYVHVMIHKPTEGRVMLIGLGKRRERAGQSPETEQFWSLSSFTITPGAWNDAVFAIKGAGGIDIYSLVVVPDCESTHNLKEDFAVYIDEITVDDNASPRFRCGDYVINFEDDATTNRSDRKLTGVSLNGSVSGQQQLTWGSLSPAPLFQTVLDKSFAAKPGETLTPTFSYVGNWMNGYVYLDRGSDGRFDVSLNDDYTISEGSDLMTYAYVETVTGTEGYLSDGTKVSGDNRNVLNPPAFTVPADLPVGYYRLRFKVDWGDVDPGGAATIIEDGGMIVDTRLNIHADVCHITNANRNGDVLSADGEALNGYEAPWGEPFTVKMVPENGFTYEGIRVRYGYNLSGDSLVHSTPQYVDVVYPAYLFTDDTFTIPADVMTADVQITGLFVEEGKGEEGEDYALNFDRSLTVTRTDRHLDSFTLKAASSSARTLTLDDSRGNYVYRDMTQVEVPAKAGDEITTTAVYQGHAMHGYLYVDFNQDGRFDAQLNADGTPTMAGELLSYTYYSGRNSAGEAITSNPGEVSLASLPAFTLPESLPAGVYRARFKVDWNNIDPAGQYAEGGSNLINDNGGYIVDFLINVYHDTQKFEVLTENGSVNGSGNTGLPLYVPCFKSLAVVPTPAIEGFTAEQMTIRHGHNFDGPQYVHGNRQWSEYTVAATDYTIPADSLNGDVTLTVNYTVDPATGYKLVFADEFNAADGSQPDAAKWGRCPRQTSTWNRWLSDSEQVVYLEDGQLVTRAIPNPDTATDPVPMITGGVQTSGKFDFKYGKIEARILTNPHSGNFPAFWMMPTDQSLGWPVCGEIDIWEQINTQNTAFHTVHSNWTNILGQTENPTSSFNETVEMDRYHTYGFEWDETSMRWYVDGKQVGSYAKSTSLSALMLGQWPFDKEFYIILNQSVGDGSWAAAADESHTYETRFDWVRVYQQTSLPTSMDGAVDAYAGLSVTTSRGQIHLSSAQPVDVLVSDVAGRVVFSGKVSAPVTVSVSRGVYVVGGRKVIVP